MPLSQETASVIGSGMGLIGNLFSGIGTRRNKKYAKEMMDYQNKLELERMEQQFGYQQQAQKKNNSMLWICTTISSTRNRHTIERCSKTKESTTLQ